MRPDNTYYTCTKNTCTNGNNGNDYESILKMIRKLNAKGNTVATVQYVNLNCKDIIAFGALGTMAFIFEGDNLTDMASSNLSFAEWISAEFLHSNSEGNIITIYR